MSDNELVPFLKWPGGKRWIVEKLVRNIPDFDGKYIEPFLGSGALFFALKPDYAILSDVNNELIEVYLVMREQPSELREKILYHQRHHCKEYYYKVRSLKPRTAVNRAARFLYLNRTCFNGMYRVNSKGEFNVPIGSKNDCVYDIDKFEEYAVLLQKKQIMSGDFTKAISLAETGDVIFADPPYAMMNDSQFLKYNGQLFNWNDQERLLQELKSANERGVNILMTNAYCKEIIEMYSDAGFWVGEESRVCSIAGKAEKRRAIKELLISSQKIIDLENT
ncbi:MAG: Dam family site-specific DNA-(adenine-N6)-methyltransferase [Eubacterium sp.]|nr:Dam family site-specific DNA-(adenine-N6)-methyltransferase [Eubacterium sp.]